MTNTKETFAWHMETFSLKYAAAQVFDDFLTLSLCSVTRNPRTGKSVYEDLYLETIAKYKDDDLRHRFPLMFDALVDEMEERVNSESGNDVLGEYYETHCAKKEKSQFFTPWYICTYMAEQSVKEAKREEGVPLRILDPACGSGRFILVSAKVAGPANEFYAVDIDHTCVRMTALNLFLNGIFNAEVMCADFLLPDRFEVSYFVSFKPLGIFKIPKKEESRLWNLMRLKLEANAKEELEKRKKPIVEVKLPSETGEKVSADMKQSTLF